MTAKLHLGDESKIQMPDLFSSLTLDELPTAEAGLPSSAPVIGEDYREVRLSVITQQSPIQTRAPFDPENDDEDQALVASLEAEGQKQPITLAEVEGSRPTEYRLLDGHRRVDALFHLQRETAKAIITRPRTLEADLITLTAHVRKNLTPIEMAQAVSRLKERHGLNLDQIARKTGIARRRLSEMTAFMRADPALQLEAEKGRLTAEVAFTLSQAPAQHQAQLAKIAAAASLKSPTAKRLVERVATSGESPDKAALAIGVGLPGNSGVGEHQTEAQDKSAEFPKSNAAAARKHVNASRRPQPITSQSAAAVLADLFPEIDPMATSTLAEIAAEHSVTLEVLKLAGLLVLAGQEPQAAVKASSAEASTPIGKKVLLMLNTIADICIRKSQLSETQQLMLAGTAKKINALHLQSVEEA